MDRIRESITALDTAVTPPRKNGELVFETPWESRAFGMAVALHGEGVYSWNEFSAQLAARIAAKDSSGLDEAVLPVMPGAETAYYERWLEALEMLLTEKGLLSGDELEARVAEFAAGKWDHEH